MDADAADKTERNHHDQQQFSHPTTPFAGLNAGQ
jgi:hypothetical protein